MKMSDIGIQISTRGLSLMGEQLVTLQKPHGEQDLIILKNGILSSYRYDPRHESGFVANAAASSFISQAEEFKVKGSKIVEIAGGKFLKVRYDNGMCLEGLPTYAGTYTIIEYQDVARVTKTKRYSLVEPISYFKSGPGKAPLIPLLDGNIVAVFEGIDGDLVVTIDDLISSDGKSICGSVAGFMVTGEEGSYTVHTPNGNISISAFATFTRDLAEVSKIEVSSNINRDYSDVFPPAHYAYIKANQKKHLSQWAGFGEVGYVVSSPDLEYMNVPKGMDFNGAKHMGIVSQGDEVFKIVGSGVLEPIEQINLNGQSLVEYVYAHNMSDLLVMGSMGIFEAYYVNGYNFSHPLGYMENATLSLA